jgi:hypothetical protein
MYEMLLGPDNVPLFYGNHLIDYGPHELPYKLKEKWALDKLLFTWW